MDTYAFAIDLARKTGDRLLEARAKGFSVGNKGGNVRDVITELDHEMNRDIIAAITGAFPDDALYSEEGGGNAKDASRKWMIDPIDGTANFARGIPHFCVSIGLLEGGVPVVGAVYNPVTRELFSFEKGKGAFLNDEPIRVSDVRELIDAQVLFSPGSRKKELWDWAGISYRKLLEHTKKRGFYGSSALDICFIASGRVDIAAYGTLTTLDIGAALGILYEAGGAAVNVSGDPLELTAEPQKAYLGNTKEMAESIRVLLET